jgi:hypothetical protein
LNLHLDSSVLEAIFRVPENDGTYPQSVRDILAAQGARRRSVFLAFPPKAAGTFLRAAAVEATGGEVLRVCYAQGDRDGQPYLPTFLAYYAGGFCEGPMVTHLHMQAFPANIAFLEALDIRPVVMLRSIPDMLASYWDMLEEGDIGWPMGVNFTVPPDFRIMPPQQRAEFMIEIVAPWYVGYYATWSCYAQASPDSVCMLRYSDFLRQPAETLEQILRFSGMERSLEECRAAIATVWVQRYEHRFSEGVEGRARDYFSPQQVAHIGRMLSYYPSTAPMTAELLGGQSAMAGCSAS